jgi:hypothetical protein
MRYLSLNILSANRAIILNGKYGSGCAFDMVFG